MTAEISIKRTETPDAPNKTQSRMKRLPLYSWVFAVPRLQVTKGYKKVQGVEPEIAVDKSICNANEEAVLPTHLISPSGVENVVSDKSATITAALGPPVCPCGSPWKKRHQEGELECTTFKKR